jgi:hypothetical protein
MFSQEKGRRKQAWRGGEFILIEHLYAHPGLCTLYNAHSPSYLIFTIATTINILHLRKLRHREVK